MSSKRGREEISCCYCEKTELQCKIKRIWTEGMEVFVCKPCLKERTCPICIQKSEDSDICLGIPGVDPDDEMRDESLWNPIWPPELPLSCKPTVFCHYECDLEQVHIWIHMGASNEWNADRNPACLIPWIRSNFHGLDDDESMLDDCTLHSQHQDEFERIFCFIATYDVCSGREL